MAVYPFPGLPVEQPDGHPVIPRTPEIAEPINVQIILDEAAVLTNANVPASGGLAVRLDTGLANRKSVTIVVPAASASAIYVGFTPTTKNGAPAAGDTQGEKLTAGTSWSRSLGPHIPIYAYADTQCVVQVEEYA